MSEPPRVAMSATKSTKKVTPEVRAQWRKEWQMVGREEIRRLLLNPRIDLRIDEDGYPRDTRRNEAWAWIVDLEKQAEADRRWVWWHSWVNTAIAVGGFVLAFVAL